MWRRVSAEDPSVVKKAETEARAKVAARLEASRNRYPGDAQLYPVGSASCKPFSDKQLDREQQVKDETNPWTGTSKWRATVDGSGDVTVA